MAFSDTLKAALTHSPDNIPLLLHAEARPVHGALAAGSSIGVLMALTELLSGPALLAGILGLTLTSLTAALSTLVALFNIKRRPD